jgi:lysophospholipase L1-like esterase
MPLHRSAAILMLLSAASQLAPAQIPVQSGDKVAFLGDSITEAGHDNPGGYVQLLRTALAAHGIAIEIVAAGVSGHKSNQMLERLERDVLSKQPQWLALSCGVNDVWHGKNGVPLADYQKNIRSIVDQAQTAGIKVVILTSTMIGEDPANKNNQKLVPYNEFLRSLAAEKHCLLADLNAEMQAALAEAGKAPAQPAKEYVLTTDGVHMAFAGDVMMAVGMLKTFGLDAAQIAKAREVWLDAPATNQLNAQVSITQRQAQQLEKLAVARNVSVDDLLNQEFSKLVRSLLPAEKR